MSRQNSEKIDFDLEASNAFTLKGEEETQIDQSTRIEIETNKKHQRATNSQRSIRINNLTNYSFGISESKLNDEENDINETKIDLIGTFKKNKNNVIPKERKCDSVVKIKFTKMKKAKMAKASGKGNSKSKNLTEVVQLCDKEIDNLIESSSMNKDEASEENKMDLDLIEKKDDNKEKEMERDMKDLIIEESAFDDNLNNNGENIECDQKMKEDIDMNNVNDVFQEENNIKDKISDMIIEPEKIEDFTKEKENGNDIFNNSQKEENNVINEISKMTLENEENKEENVNDIIIEINKEKIVDNIQENISTKNIEEERCEVNKEVQKDDKKEEKEQEIKEYKMEVNDKKTTEDEEGKNKEKALNNESTEKKEEKTQTQSNPVEEFNKEIDQIKNNINDNKKEESKEEDNKEEGNKEGENKDYKEENIIEQEKDLNILNCKTKEENTKEEKDQNGQNKEIKDEEENKMDTTKNVKHEESKEAKDKVNNNILENMNDILMKDFLEKMFQQMKNEIVKECLNKKNEIPEAPLNSEEKSIPENNSDNNLLGKKRKKTLPNELNEDDRKDNDKIIEKEKDTINANESNEKKEKKKEKEQINNEKVNNSEKSSLYNSLEELIFNFLYEKIMKESLSNDNELERQLSLLIADKGYSNVKASLINIKKDKDKKENENNLSKDNKQIKEYHYQFKNNFYHRYKFVKVNDGIQIYSCCDKDCQAYAKLNVKERKFDVIIAHTLPLKEHINFNDDRSVYFMRSRKLDEVHIKKNDHNDKYHLEWFK